MDTSRSPGPTDSSWAGEPLLAIHHLQKSFGGLKAIQDLNIQVQPNEIFAVIGPNGSGKTTLFNIISGVTPGDSGSISWQAGQDEIMGKKPWQIFRLGISRTFQNIRLSLGLSILDNVMVGLYLSTRTSWWEALLNMGRLKRRDEQARHMAMEVLEFMGPQLARNSDRLVAELSYPDRRRVEIARAIVSNPKLLLLDEPTAGMNTSETDEIRDEILKVNARGVAILLIEHKMKFVSHLAKRIAVLNFGQKIAEGIYSDVRQDENVIKAYLGSRRTD